MSIELMLNAANLTFLAAARGTANANQASAYAVFVILMAAAEAAIGLALILALFRLKQSTELDAASDLRGYPKTRLSAIPLIPLPPLAGFLLCAALHARTLRRRRVDPKAQAPEGLVSLI